MRIGLLADIHGNGHALKSVLKSAKEKKIEKLLCCGDYIGYYYEPNKVLSQLNEWDWEGVSGNHEAMLKDWISEPNKTKIQAKYGSGIAIAANELTNESAAFLYEMPSNCKIQIENYKVILCHGSPWDRDLYIYPDAKQELLDKLFNYDSDFDMLVYGHTHYPVIWEKGNKKIVNPGSVGQPRNRKSGAAWALWDTTNNDVVFFIESYDVYPVVEMCNKFDPEIKYLADVLVRK